MKYLLVISILLTHVAFSAEEPTESSEFQLDKGLVDRLYKESVTESERATLQHSANVTVSALFSLFNPAALTLSNDYFEVPYSQGIGSVPSLSIGASGRIFSVGGLYLMGTGGVGYSMKEVVQTVSSKTASSDPNRTTRITLHWLPLSIGTRLEYRFSGFEAVRPFLSAKGGAEWLYQVGSLDGLEQGFWVPFVQYGAGLTLFDSASSPDRWFGGVTVGISKHQSFSSAQSVEGTVFDLGVNILL